LTRTPVLLPFYLLAEVIMTYMKHVKGKAVPLHAMEALGGEEI
jgi:hypothetical protein